MQYFIDEIRAQAWKCTHIYTYTNIREGEGEMQRGRDGREPVDSSRPAIPTHGYETRALHAEQA